MLCLKKYDVIEDFVKILKENNLIPTDNPCPVPRGEIGGDGELDRGQGVASLAPPRLVDISTDQLSVQNKKPTTNKTKTD